MMWKDKRVRVFGDIMLDHYISGSADRVSPEAPVLVVSKKEERYVPGGAANAAANVATLGANAQLYGVVGSDTNGAILMQELCKANIAYEDCVVVDPCRPTTCKTRVMAGNHQLCRIDHESTENISNLENKLLLQLARRPLPDALIISDYGKGVITQKALSYVVPFYADMNIPVIIAPKPRHGIEYVGGYLTVPNKKEAEALANRPINNLDDVRKVGRLLEQKLKSNILITLGEGGMMLFESEKEPYHLPTVAKQVFDVSGAGDTVVAAIAVALAGKMPLRQAVELANRAAGIKVTKSGTATVSYQELFQSA